LVVWSLSRQSLWPPGTSGPRLPEDEVGELRELISSAGGVTVGVSLQLAPEPDPATLIGRGKVEEVRSRARACEAECVVFDHDLTPTQLRNLERALDMTVVDRTQLILDIFARRARTREGKLQVELAQLTYLLPRLAGRGALLSRLGGGIGTRGPGEQQLEYDRRRIRTRIKKLKDGIEGIRSQRSIHRAHRAEQEFRTVALVGYTNAGKSTLFNALCGAAVETSPRMFATLDPVVRTLRLASRRKVLLSDTVGFIHHLPAPLAEAFRATFEELQTADLLLHVSDASKPQHAEQDRNVEELIEAMGLAAIPRLRVWNKIDLIVPAARQRLPRGQNDIAVSAQTGEGISELLLQIDRSLDPDPVVETVFEIPSADGKSLALLHRLGTVMTTTVVDDRLLVHVRVTASAEARLHAALRMG
jgi:GTPase